MSAAGGDSADSVDDVSIPRFKDKWKAEYQRCNFHPQVFIGCCWISSVYLLLKGSKGYVDEDSASREWRVFTWAPYFITSAIYFVSALIMSFRPLFFRDFCVRNYDSICACTILAIHFTVIVPKMVIELRRSKFEPLTSSHVQWQIDFSQFPPTRSCTDTNPWKTWTNPKIPELNLSNVGCINMLFWGGFLCEYIVVNLYPIIFRMKPRSAIMISTADFLVLVFAMLAIGTQVGMLFCGIAIHLAVGLSTVIVCNAREAASKEQFCIAKAMKLVAAKRLRLLHTLIPNNVMMKIAANRNAEMPGALIPHCTIMFCLLEPQTVSQSAASEHKFNFLNNIFSEFDEIVERFGMFKYHHVGDSYVVACPRAACPFDEDEQAMKYPDNFSLDMVLLADQLQKATSRHILWDGNSLSLKAGIACGPIAGCVLGQHRSFYCLVGDTINTASRMCKHAQERIHATADFASILKDQQVPFLVCHSRGLIEVKGCGQMETFDISIDEASLLHDELTAWRRRSSDGSRSDLPVTVMHEVDLTSLSPETRQLVNMGVIDGRLMRFRDPVMEARFSRAHAAAHARNLGMGIALHWFTAAIQWQQIVFPEFGYGFRQVNAVDLEEALFRVERLLGLHFAATSALCLALVAALLSPAPRIRAIEVGLCAVKVLHIAVCALAFHSFPGHVVWLVIFTVEAVCLHGWLQTMSYSSNLAMSVGSVAFATGLACAELVGLGGASLIKTYTYALGSIWLARAAERNERVMWLQQWVLGAEQRLFREKLFDLLPPAIASRRIELEAGSLPPPERMVAVVLQLDLVGYTALARTLPPMEAATIMHRLFSDFDVAVRELGLFKLDTIGDAYVVAGFLSAPDSAVPSPAPRRRSLSSADGDFTARSPGAAKFAVGDVSAEGGGAVDAEEARAVSRDVLRLALRMIRAVEACREDTGRPVHCRIGVSIGPVVAGTLGRLQPRFHLLGAGARSAELHEQAGRTDSVNASEEFLRALGPVRDGDDLPIPAEVLLGPGGAVATGGWVSERVDAPVDESEMQAVADGASWGGGGAEKEAAAATAAAAEEEGIRRRRRSLLITPPGSLRRMLTSETPE